MSNWIIERKAQVFGVKFINKFWTAQVMRELNEDSQTWDFVGFRFIECRHAASTTKNVHALYYPNERTLLFDDVVPHSVRKAAAEWMREAGIKRQTSITEELLSVRLNEAYESLNELELLHSEVRRGKEQFRCKSHSAKMIAEIKKPGIEKFAGIYKEIDPAYYEEYCDKYEQVMDYVNGNPERKAED